MSSLSKSAKRTWQQLLGQEPEPEESQGIIGGLQSNVDNCCGTMCKLTRKQRLYGFAICFALGFVISIVGSIFIATGKTIPFAVCYSIGTVLSLSSSLFLWGPWHQIKNMFKETRWLATVIMLIAIAMTLVSAIVWKSVGLTLLFALIQFCAVFWYCISYIPFARGMVKNCAQSCMA
eukprot:TRINITY_DN6235_c0_g1_i2.p1 TRINITY_DN6235_c0_g1~~TRINITY_DN6235_c0_g1_i2.p1  ORF type:complete len:177 (+),score=16.16 TRINITY_DN6235_c0_g1_i2:202-732(+)